MQSLVQVISTIDTRFNLPTPAWYRQLMKMLSAINLNFINAVPVGCIYPWINFHHELMFQTLCPLVMICTLLVLAPLLRRCAAHLSSMCWSAVFLILFLAYPGCTSISFDTFQCVSVTDGIEGGHASQWLRADLRIDCDSTVHVMMMLYAALML